MARARAAFFFQGRGVGIDGTSLSYVIIERRGLVHDEWRKARERATDSETSERATHRGRFHPLYLGRRDRAGRGLGECSHRGLELQRGGEACRPRLDRKRYAGHEAELGDNGDVHQPELMGLRFDLKPLPLLEIGLARTWVLNGRGSGVKGATDLSFNDWMDILFKGNSEGELDVDQRAGLDAILRIPDVDRWLSLMKTFELWSEFYGEDEAGHLPSKWAYAVGAKFGDLFLTGKTDLILEYANDVINGKPGLWYINQHYPQGYTYKGDILGHNMGSDARDYFVRLEQYLSPALVLGLDCNRQERGVEAEVEEDINRFDLDCTYQGLARMTVRLGYRFETIDNLDQVKGNDQHNRIFWTNVVVSF